MVELWWPDREVSLVEVPDRYIDEFDLHLKRGTRDEIDGWVHVVGAPVGSEIKVSLDKDGLTTGVTGKTEADGKAQIHFVDAKLQLWSPEHPVLYRVVLAAGEDRLEDEMGFRTIETREHNTSERQPIFLKGISVPPRLLSHRPRVSEQDAEALLGWVHELEKLCPLGPLSAQRAHDAACGSHGHTGVVGNTRLLACHFETWWC